MKGQVFPSLVYTSFVYTSKSILIATELLDHITQHVLISLTSTGFRSSNKRIGAPTGPTILHLEIDQINMSRSES